MKKIITLSLALALGASAYAQNIKVLTCGEGVPGVDEPQLMGLGISPDGNYVCGPIENGGGIFVADVRTGEVQWDMADGEDGGELRNVDNNGVAVGFTEGGIKYSFADGIQEEVVAPEGYRYVLCEDITGDGSFMIGSLVGDSGTQGAYCPDGKTWHILPMPTDEQLGDYKNKISRDSAAKCVSSDGKVILGYLGSFSVPVVWIRNDKGEYEVDFFLTHYADYSPEKGQTLAAISAMYLSMSNNGKYLAMVGLMHEAANNDREENTFNVPVIYDSETRQINVYSEHQDIDENGIGLYPTAICDDGSFIGSIGQPFFGSYGSFIMKAGQTQAITYLKAFPTYKEKFEKGDYYGLNMPTGMSADGKYILGYIFYCEDYMSETADAYYATYIIDAEAEAEASITPVKADATEATPEAYYSIDGRRQGNPVKGLNIIRMSDGTARKVIVK